MKKQLKLRSRIFFPLSLLIIIILVLTASLFSHRYSERVSLYQFKEGMKLATDISRLIHATQKERGMSSGYLATEGKEFKYTLLQQRQESDRNIQRLYGVLTQIDDPNISQALSKALQRVLQLKTIRHEIDTLSISAEKSLAFYSQMNKQLLDVIVEISKLLKFSNLSENMQSYVNFLYAKEYAGIERALGTEMLAKKYYPHKRYIHFIQLDTTERVYIDIFSKYASTDVKHFYRTLSHDASFQRVEQMKQQIFSHIDGAPSIDVREWFEANTHKINNLQKVDNYLEKEIFSGIALRMEESNKMLLLYAVLNILSIVSFLLMIIVIIKLVKSEKRLKEITDKYIISSTTDTKGRIIEVSDAFCKISGYSREELIGKPHNIIRHPDMPKSAFKSMWDTIQSGKTWSGRVKNRTKHNGYYWVYANIEPLLDKKGKIEGYAAVRLDITDSVHLKEELERSKEKDQTLLQQSKLAQMGEMISMIAHQWRQPLTSIASLSNDMYMKNMLGRYEKRYFEEKLEKIGELSQFLSNTIDDFRNFYKEEKEKQSIQCEEVVEGALNIISSSLTNKKITLKSDFQCHKTIHVLANEMRQVILNLIKNAEDILIEKEIDSPTIWVRTYHNESCAYLEVSDNAGGIPEEIKGKIFEPYFSTKPKKEGTGLGLYMSKLIIEDHCHGKLYVKNGKEGACFTIQIPLFENMEKV